MEFEKVLRNRVSTRRYTEKMPSEEDIQKILDAALLGPIVQHKIHITVVTNKKAMKMAEEAAEKVIGPAMPKPYLYGAPVWIVISGEKYKEGSYFAPLSIDSIDATMAQRFNENLFWMTGSVIENMCLEATNLGLANCAINTTVVSLLGNTKVKEAVGIPQGYEPLASLIVGYPVSPIKERPVQPDRIPISYNR